jgi:predicted RNase H-like HicB family nuclease
MKFNVVIEVDEEGRYVAECTDLPGCLSEGETFEEAIDNISEAIIGCLESRLKEARSKIGKAEVQQKTNISLEITHV